MPIVVWLVHGPDRDQLAPRLVAAFWLVMLLPGNPGFRRNPVGSTEHQAMHILALLDH